MLTANRFGRRNVGTIYGWITCSHMVGGAAAAAIAGIIHDATGDYIIPIYLSAVLGLVAAAAAFNIGTGGGRTTGPAMTPEPAAGY
jgi:sugar phosphate permease